MPSKHFIGGRSSFVDGPRRPWPSRRRYCSGLVVPGPRRVASISGPTGCRRCHRYGTLIKRRLRVRSSRSRFGSSSGTPGPGVARELQFKSHFKGEARLWEFNQTEPRKVYRGDKYNMRLVLSECTDFAAQKQQAGGILREQGGQ
jgi:hypothetical protein